MTGTRLLSLCNERIRLLKKKEEEKERTSDLNNVPEPKIFSESQKEGESLSTLLREPFH